MKTLHISIIVGITLIGISFFSIIPVLCNELSLKLEIAPCSTWEFFYDMLPFALVLFVIGFVGVVKGYGWVRTIWS